MAVLKSFILNSLRSIPKENDRFAALLLVVFILLGVIGLVHHEMWRDELQIWMLVRDSDSIGQLFQNLRYETGHPFLWYFCLYGFSRLTRNPVAMQLVHLAIAATTVYLIARYSPFTRLQKCLLTFGYFSIYEYSIINRNYGLGVLFLIAFCVHFPWRFQSCWLLSVLLFLAANSNFYAFLCAIVLGLFLVFDVLWNRKQGNAGQANPFDLAVSFLIWIAGLAIAVLQMIPPEDAGISVSTLPETFQWSHLASTLAILWKSYVPLPGIAYHFWNTHLLDDGSAAVLACGLFVIAVSFFVRQSLILFLYLAGTLEILLFAYFKHSGAMRHWGYLFILFLVCLWLSSSYSGGIKSWNHSQKLHLIRKPFKLQRASFLTILFSLHLIAGMFAYGMDLFHPFSQAKAVAQFIESNAGDEKIAGDRDWAAIPVSGFLDQSIYYPASDRVGTFVIWNNQRRTVSETELLEKVNRLRTETQRPVLLVLNYRLNTLPVIHQFEGAIVKDENYFLYRL